MRGTARSWFALSLAQCVACDDGLAIELPPGRFESPVSDPDGGDRVAACDQAADGTPCGLERHCLFNVCADNACGDGIRAGLEACDDGNERDHDGCDMRCRVEVSPGCGNGVLEPGEECDDGDATAADGCEPDCTTGEAPLDAGAGVDGGHEDDAGGMPSRRLSGLRAETPEST